MNYAFLIILGAFLVVASPLLMIGAWREGTRRKEARARASQAKLDERGGVEQNKIIKQCITEEL